MRYKVIFVILSPNNFFVYEKLEKKNLVFCALFYVDSIDSDFSCSLQFLNYNTNIFSKQNTLYILKIHFSFIIHDTDKCAMGVSDL